MFSVLREFLSLWIGNLLRSPKDRPSFKERAFETSLGEELITSSMGKIPFEIVFG